MPNIESKGNKDPLDGLDAVALISDLNIFFLSGGRFLKPPQTDLLPQDPLLVYERISEKTDRRSIIIEQFVVQLDHLGVRNETLEKAADYIPLGLRNYRGITSSSLRNQNASETDIALVEGLTLQDVALYVHQQYREISDRLVIMSVGSPEHRKSLEKAFFWSEMDERISLAASSSV